MVWNGKYAWCNKLAGFVGLVKGEVPKSSFICCWKQDSLTRGCEWNSVHRFSWWNHKGKLCSLCDVWDLIVTYKIMLVDTEGPVLWRFISINRQQSVQFKWFDHLVSLDWVSRLSVNDVKFTLRGWWWLHAMCAMMCWFILTFVRAGMVIDLDELNLTSANH